MSKSSQAPFLYTGNYNIYFLNENTTNQLSIKDETIYFQNNAIDGNQLINKLAIYQGSFDIQSNDNSLIYGISNLNSITISGGSFQKSVIINNESVNLYKGLITLTCSSIVPNSFLYAVNENDKIYKTQIIYNELGKKQKCDSYTFQSYDTETLGLEQKNYYLSEISKRVNCMKSSVFRNRKLDTQQTLYASMRRNPEKYPIISWVKNMNLTLAEQRNYSNLWYRQFGTSQGLPVNDNFGGFYCVGSDVPYTN
jgi:hypothetical protein